MNATVCQESPLYIRVADHVAVHACYCPGTGRWSALGPTDRIVEGTLDEVFARAVRHRHLGPMITIDEARQHERPAANVGGDYRDVTTKADRVRAREAITACVTVSPDMQELANLAASEVTSPSGYFLGQPTAHPSSPMIHVDPRLPERTYHEGPPRP